MAETQQGRMVRDLVPPELLLPTDPGYLLVPRTEEGRLIVRPVDVGRVLFSSPFFRHISTSLIAAIQESSPEEVLGLDSDWMGDKSQTLARVALDPNRNKPVSMLKAYEHQLWITGGKQPRFSGQGDAEFFSTFAADHGILPT